MTQSRSRLALTLSPAGGAALLAAILISACSTAPTATPTVPARAPSPTAEAGSVAVEELTVDVAATDLAVGRNRFAFGQSGFLVQAESSAPGLDEVPPPIVNRTTADVSGLAELTSARAA